METVELYCVNGHPTHPRKVGKVTFDDEGVFLTALKRTGKGSGRALETGSRLVEQGIPIQVFWRGMSAGSFDTEAEGLAWGNHLYLVKANPPIGLYSCPEGHWVGTGHIDELLEGVTKALALGSSILPLPLAPKDDVQRALAEAADRDAIEATIPMETAVRLPA